MRKYQLIFLRISTVQAITTEKQLLDQVCDTQLRAKAEIMDGWPHQRQQHQSRGATTASSYESSSSVERQQCSSCSCGTTGTATELKSTIEYRFIAFITTPALREGRLRRLLVLRHLQLLALAAARTQ